MVFATRTTISANARVYLKGSVKGIEGEEGGGEIRYVACVLVRIEMYHSFNSLIDLTCCTLVHSYGMISPT